MQKLYYIFISLFILHTTIAHTCASEFISDKKLLEKEIKLWKSFPRGEINKLSALYLDAAKKPNTSKEFKQNCDFTHNFIQNVIKTKDKQVIKNIINKNYNTWYKRKEIVENNNPLLQDARIQLENLSTNHISEFKVFINTLTESEFEIEIQKYKNEPENATLTSNQKKAYAYSMNLMSKLNDSFHENNHDRLDMLVRKNGNQWHYWSSIIAEEQKIRGFKARSKSTLLDVKSTSLTIDQETCKLKAMSELTLLAADDKKIDSSAKEYMKIRREMLVKDAPLATNKKFHTSLNNIITLLTMLKDPQFSQKQVIEANAQNWTIWTKLVRNKFNEIHIDYCLGTRHS